MLTVACDESTMSRTQVQLWYNQFKEGRVDVNDVCHGRPSTAATDENIKAVKKMILDNHRITIRKIADDVGISAELMPSNFYGCFRHEMCGYEDYSKI